jgi:hypothetical protein
MEPGPINHASATGFPKPRPWALLRGGVLVGRIANLRRPALRLSSPARSLGCIRAYLANRRATVVLRAPIPGFATRLALDGFNVRTGHDVMATLILYRGPVLRHSAELIQAANFRSAVAF